MFSASFCALWVTTALLGLVATSPLVDTGGKPRCFELTLTWEKSAPDGFSRDIILTNGKFPGPRMELNEGDDVEVLVHNKLPFNTSVHYHGMSLNG